jgi:E3 ubiquitin-protein ligase RNF213
MNYLARMELPPAVAMNTALLENVFILLVCILNKIPAFLVGKPGCSKSLSMQLIYNNLKGRDSKDEFFKTLPQARQLLPKAASPHLVASTVGLRVGTDPL